MKRAAVVGPGGPRVAVLGSGIRCFAGPPRPGSPCCFAPRAGRKHFALRFFFFFFFFLRFLYSPFYFLIFLERSFSSRDRDVGPVASRFHGRSNDCSYTVWWGLSHLDPPDSDVRSCRGLAPEAWEAGGLVGGISLAASASAAGLQRREVPGGRGTCHCSQPAVIVFLVFPSCHDRS